MQLRQGVGEDGPQLAESHDNAVIYKKMKRYGIE